MIWSREQSRGNGVLFGPPGQRDLEYLLESRGSRKVRYVLALSDGTHLLVLRGPVRSHPVPSEQESVREAG